MQQQESPIYQTILDLPLIKGVSAARLTEIAGRYKLNFKKYAPGSVIINVGDRCECLKFVLSGSVSMAIADADETLVIQQTLTAPQVIAPDYLFGRLTEYPCSVKAESSVGIMEISKEEYRKMLASDSVFLFNYLNAVCSRSQRGVRGLLALISGSAVERIAYWISTLTQFGATDIRVTSERADLNTLLGISASAWRGAMERMRSAGIIVDVTPRSFSVTSRAALAALLPGV
ncbi:MAG: Crp/Fnr family transcriptional regulator [Muribaculaceae bacterium]|nr:Crp/Fnr family transcriptional regulator [Muribaculaceae bacterium]MDE7110271.1 Crp/Fnr family transcriptional regulator [Muribaculaceae bacterium]